jgi:hypothetical protein
VKSKDLAISRPCEHCPFRHDIVPFLSKARMQSIRDDARQGQHFVCHETVDYGGEPAKIRRACAGFLLLCRREKWHGFKLYDTLPYVQLAARLGGVDLDLRGADKVFKSFDDAINAQDD